MILLEKDKKEMKNIMLGLHIDNSCKVWFKQLIETTVKPV
jgi:hypothetical protein